MRFETQQVRVPAPQSDSKSDDTEEEEEEGEEEPAGEDEEEPEGVLQVATQLDSGGATPTSTPPRNTRAC